MTASAIEPHSHTCPVVAAAGQVDPAWCIDNFAASLAAMPTVRTEADTTHPDLFLAESGRFTLRYCPVDAVNPQASVVIVGITPGRHQMFLACREAQRALRDGADIADALRRARGAAAFAGPMRTNLIAMLDEVALPASLGIDTAAELFSGRSDLLHSTSAVLCPAFVDGANYSGHPDPRKVPLLQPFVEHVFPAELALLPDALIIGLGKTVAALLRDLIERGELRSERCLLDFPHPSGANGHRRRLFAERRDAMATQTARWGDRRRSGSLPDGEPSTNA